MDRVRLAAMHAHQRDLTIVNETGMNLGEIVSRGRNRYRVSISDEVEGENWEVRTDARCEILSVTNL